MPSDRNSSNGLQPETKPLTKREPTQAKLLQLIITEVEDRLAQSLHNAVPLTLGIERQDDRVRPATVIQPQRPREVLAPETQISEIFDRPEIARQLLILGEPGSGKTTTLLELAKELLNRAKRDASEPIPVILDLSTWKGSGQPIAEWLSTELKAKYGLRPDFARNWVEKQQLLPLLDGLDEVAPQHQEASVQALNAWLVGTLEPKPCGVVICCRHEEFEKGLGQFLNLYGAIDLKALTPQQIEEYLAQLDLQDVWQTVHQDAALQELLTKPLFLSMFALIAAQGKFVAQDWRSRSTSKAKAEYLLDIYWETAMARELILDPEIRKQGIRSKAYGQNPLPSRQFVRRTLVFAAKNLSRDFSADIAIENLQPSALQNQRQKRIYRLIVELVDGSIYGLIVGLVFGLIEGLPYGPMLGLVFALTLALSCSLLYGLISGLISVLTSRPSKEPNKIEFVEIVSISGLKKSQRGIFQLLTACLIISLSEGLAWGVNFVVMTSLLIGLKFALKFGFYFNLLIGLFLGFSIGLINGLIFTLKADIENRSKSNQGIKKLLKNVLVASVVSLAIALPLKFFIEHVLENIVDSTELPALVALYVLSLIWSGFLAGGGKVLLQHIALRIVLAWNRYAPFRYDLLLDYCTERLLLQRIGGRYRFMHRLLQDHFAQMDL